MLFLKKIGLFRSFLPLEQSNHGLVYHTRFIDHPLRPIDHFTHPHGSISAVFRRCGIAAGKRIPRSVIP